MGTWELISSDYMLTKMTTPIEVKHPCEVKPFQGDIRINCTKETIEQGRANGLIFTSQWTTDIYFLFLCYHSHLPKVCYPYPIGTQSSPWCTPNQGSIRRRVEKTNPHNEYRGDIFLNGSLWNLHRQYGGCYSWIQKHPAPYSKGLPYLLQPMKFELYTIYINWNG